MVYLHWSLDISCFVFMLSPRMLDFFFFLSIFKSYLFGCYFSAFFMLDINLFTKVTKPWNTSFIQLSLKRNLVKMSDETYDRLYFRLEGSASLTYSPLLTNAYKGTQQDSWYEEESDFQRLLCFNSRRPFFYLGFAFNACVSIFDPSNCCLNNLALCSCL